MTKTNLEIEEVIDEILGNFEGEFSYNRGQVRTILVNLLQQRMDEIEKAIPNYRSGVLERGETRDFRDGRNAGLKEVRDVLNIIKSVDKNNE